MNLSTETSGLYLCKINSILTLYTTDFLEHDHEHYLEFDSHRFADSRDIDTHDPSPIEYDCCDLFDCCRLSRAFRYRTLLALKKLYGTNALCVDLMVDRRFTVSFYFAMNLQKSFDL
jgi:hypothetical protein